jgi:hypothetical protein
MAPVIHALARRPEVHQHVHTGQRSDARMSDEMLLDLGSPESDRFLGVGSGPHGPQTARALEASERGLRPSRLLGDLLPERIAGIDLMSELLSHAELRRYRVYSLGARADVLERAPRKERFLARWGSELDVPFAMGVGSAMDVLAGVTRRAPRVWQRVGLECARRLAQEPHRLWRRYSVTNLAFIALTLCDLWRRHPGV